MTKCIDVDVYGQTLTLRPTDDEQYARELARYVDEQMQAAAQGLTSATPAKIAILAAMNIADQLFQQERRRDDAEAEMERRADVLLDCIGSRLGANDAA